MSGPNREGRDNDGGLDVEAAWADIIARWETVDDAPVGRWPAQEDVDPAAGDLLERPSDRSDEADETAAPDDPADDPADDNGYPPAGDPPEPGAARDRAVPPARATDVPDAPARSHVGGEAVRAAGARDADGHGSDDSRDDDRYVPPEPPPLPRGDLVSRLAWGGILGAPLFFVVVALFWRSAPAWLVMTAVVAFVAGFATLVARMPDRRDDGWDDGAVL